MPPPPKWTVGEGGRRGCWGVPVGGVRLLQVVGCYVGFGWNTGEDCRSWSHICSSWYLPMLHD